MMKTQSDGNVRLNSKVTKTKYHTKTLVQLSGKHRKRITEFGDLAKSTHAQWETHVARRTQKGKRKEEKESSLTHTRGERPSRIVRPRTELLIRFGTLIKQ